MGITISSSTQHQYLEQIHRNKLQKRQHNTAQPFHVFAPLNPENKYIIKHEESKKKIITTINHSQEKPQQENIVQEYQNQPLPQPAASDIRSRRKQSIGNIVRSDNDELVITDSHRQKDLSKSGISRSKKMHIGKRK